MYLISLFIFTYFTIIVNGNKLKYYSNFKFEKLVFGQEDLVADYLTLADDPKGNLPESYTTCSSVFVEFATTDVAVIQMLKQDDTPWYRVALNTNGRNYETMSETLVLWYDNPTTGKLEVEYLTSSHIPIVPASWYHVCMGLDTVSGLLRIVVNGVVMVNEEKNYFRDTIQWKPKTLEGKVFLFKGYKGYWYQHRCITSNLNIFSSMMSVEDMVSRTTGGDDCDSPGDYIRQEMILIFIFKMNFDCFIDLSWEEAQWNVTGNVKSGSVDVDHELCAR